MSRPTVVATVAALVGCANPSVAPQPGPSSSTPEVKRFSIQHSPVARDIVTGDRKFVFCEDRDCPPLSLKTLAGRRAGMVPTGLALPPSQTESRKPVSIPFAYNSANLSVEATAVLKSAVIEAKRAKAIRIVGRADSVSRDDFNSKLAQRRAATVREFLAAEGVSAPIVVDIGLVRVTAEGVYPPNEKFLGRRVDVEIVLEIINSL